MGVQHAVADAVAFAAVARILNQAEGGLADGVAAHDFRRVVGGTVVHDEDLGRPMPLGGEGENLFDRLPDTLALVIGGNDDAVRWHGGVFSLQIDQSRVVKRDYRLPEPGFGVESCGGTLRRVAA